MTARSGVMHNARDACSRQARRPTDESPSGSDAQHAGRVFHDKRSDPSARACGFPRAPGLPRYSAGTAKLRAQVRPKPSCSQTRDNLELARFLKQMRSAFDDIEIRFAKEFPLGCSVEFDDLGVEAADDQ
jgi:hypothetical protein